MRGAGVFLLFVGALITAAGYGATFLLTEHFRALGGGEIETGKALGGAAIGTFVGVPLVGWSGARVGGARLASVGALLVALGYFGLASMVTLSPLIVLAGLVIGLGWGIFFLAAPTAISERVNDAERGFWFTRFGAFQMAGIGGGPVLALALAQDLQMPTMTIFRLLAVACLVAAVCLWLFDYAAPRPVSAKAGGPVKAANWLYSLAPIIRTRAIFPVIMVGLGACVFTGLMTFQSSLVRASGLNAGVYFTVYAVVVVVSRFMLAPAINRADGDKMSVLLLALMTAGVCAMFVVQFGTAVQVLSAVLLGLGYGLVYTTIQTQVVNDAPEVHRNGALTWFVISYFVGIFGFPMVGGWLIVNAGTTVFLVVVLGCAVAELALAFMRRHRAA